jgi:hypothetical protein
LQRAPDSRALAAAAGASTFLKKKLAKFGALKTPNRNCSLRRSRKTKVFHLYRSIYLRDWLSGIVPPGVSKRYAPAPFVEKIFAPGVERK